MPTETFYKKIENLKFTKESFGKFMNPDDPLYKDYSERENEKWHDLGFNNGIDAVLRVLKDMGIT